MERAVWLAFASCLVIGYTYGQQPPLQESCQIDLAILVDKSGSIKDNGGNQNWYDVIDFTQKVIERVKENEGSNVALITFGNKPKLEFNFDTTDMGDMMSVLETLNQSLPGENTNTSGGLYMARTEVFGPQSVDDRPDVQNVVILLTDGVPTYGLNDKRLTDEKNETQILILNNEVIDQGTLIKDLNTLVITIGVSNRINETMLQILATDSIRDYFMVTDFDLLIAELDRIIESTCTVLTTPAPPTQCREDSDVYFILDTSGSIQNHRFKIIIDFLANMLVPKLAIGVQTQVGVMYFSSEDYLLFGLDEYTDVANLTKAVEKVPYMNMKTNAAASLRYLRENGFTEANGRRLGAQPIAVIFTDGESNIDSSQTLEEALKAKTAGIHIITVAVGNWIQEYELRSMASEPYESNALSAYNMSFFNEELADTIKALVCNDVDECSPTPCSCEASCEDKIGDYLCGCDGSCVGKTCEQECKEMADVVFAVDASGSMTDEHFRMELDFVRELTMMLNPAQNNIGVLRFASEAEMIFNIDEFDTMTDVMNGITMRYTGGSTNTSSAIMMATEQMFTKTPEGKRKILVLLTDGKSHSFEETWTAAIAARVSGVEIVAVGIGRGANARELTAIASGIDKNVQYVTSFDNLTDIVSDVHNAICNNVDECEFLDCGNGEEKDQIGQCECVCPNTGLSMATGSNCERACSGQIDIVFVLDSSGSIRNSRWLDIKNFLAEIIAEFQVGDDYTRFGAAFFSDDAYIGYYLDSNFMKEDVMTATTELPYLGDRTNIAAALEMTMNDLFNPDNGAREGVTKVVVLLSDAESNIRVGEAVPMAVTMRQQGITIIGLGIGDQANTLELRGITSYPHSRNLKEAKSFNDIRDNKDGKKAELMNAIVAATCDNINECGENPCQNEADCMDFPGYYFCNCNFGQGGRNCERQCNAQYDLALVLDFSDSMDNIVDIIIAFAREVVYGLPSSVRVAVVYYSDGADVLFYLDKYTDKLSMLNALSFSRYGTKTNTAAALDLLVTDVFTAAKGDSVDANVAVVMTDGGSSVNRDDTIPNANAAREAGIELYAVAFGESTQMNEVNGIADSAENVIELKNDTEVTAAARELLDKLCN